MSEKPSSDPAPGAPATGGAAPAASPGAPPAPGVLTALVCERCGNTELIRVKACWYCEKCHYKFDCYGF